jgi:ribosomal protein S17
MEDRNVRKSLQGTVVSNSMTNTVVVKVSMKYKHPIYSKLLEKSKILCAYW